MSTVSKNCLQCNAVFQSELREIKRGNGKFCSMSCANRHGALSRSKTNQPNVQCAHCQKLFYKNSSKKKNSKSGLFFCSREHKDAAQTIGGIKEIQPSHYGTAEIIDYRQLAFDNFEHKCVKCGYNKHSQVLHVHHKDHNRTNNSLINLEFRCPTCHTEHHLGLN